MTARRKYCFFDYDGTLRSRTLDAVPRSALDALERLREAGHFISLATGRLQSDALEVLAPAGIDTMVADGGNSVTIDGRLVSIEGMPLEATRAFVHRLDEDGWAWAVNHENRRTCRTRDERYASMISHLYYVPVVDPDLDIDDLDPIYKIFIPCKTGDEQGIDFSGVTWARYSDELVYVEPTDKARGIRKMMGILDAPIEDVIVFGDGTNDIDMFRPEWTNVAMGNAVPQLKERADLVTSDVDDDGIWNACVQLGLIGE